MKKGFTLIEIMTAISIFLIVMTISMGAILGIFDASDKSQSLKAVMQNLNLAVETMSREIRFGRNYHCCTAGSCAADMTAPRNCSAGGNTISFLSNDNIQTAYRFNSGAIEKSVNGGITYTRLTAPEAVIEDLTFYVLGTGDNNLQPKALIKIKGYSGTQPESRTNFTLQTLVSQRVLEN